MGQPVFTTTTGCLQCRGAAEPPRTRAAVNTIVRFPPLPSFSFSCPVPRSRSDLSLVSSGNLYCLLRRTSIEFVFTLSAAQRDGRKQGWRLAPWRALPSLTDQLLALCRAQKPFSKSAAQTADRVRHVTGSGTESPAHGTLVGEYLRFHAHFCSFRLQVGH